MIRSFIFSKGKLISQDVVLDVIRATLPDNDVHIWIDLSAPTEEERRSVLEQLFAFHPLAVEDCVNVTERPKVDDYEQYVFLVLHAVDYSAHEFQTTELNMFIGRNFLVTYHDDPIQPITSAIELVQRNAPAIAKAPDRLSYSIVDFLLDNYRPALEELTGDIAELERSVLTDRSPDILTEIMTIKSEVQRLRQIVAPQREVLARISRGEFKVIRSAMHPYYRDLLDHLARIADQADAYRDSLTNLLQVHLNLQQMQVNHVIKVLTVLATLTAPLLLVTSFYGMNIQHVPNTEWPDWRTAYSMILGVTGAITLVFYLVLRHKRWT